MVHGEGLVKGLVLFGIARYRCVVSIAIEWRETRRSRYIPVSIVMPCESVASSASARALNYLQN